MKSHYILVFVGLFSFSALAQTLPDEINYGPYQARFRVLENDTSVAQTQLNQSRKSLADMQRFIREMTGHLTDLESSVRKAETEIVSLRQEILELERYMTELRADDSRVSHDLRLRQNEESQLMGQYQQAERTLRPLEIQFARSEQRLHELQSDLAQQQRVEREALTRLNQQIALSQNYVKQIEEERSQQRQMEGELRSIESSISSIQSDISRFESGVSALNSKLNADRSKLSSIQAQVQINRSEFERLRSSGAPANEIAQAQRIYEASKNAQDRAASDVKQTEVQISRIESQMSSLQAKISELRRNQQTLPAKIAQSENRQRQLASQQSQAESEIGRWQGEYNHARRNSEARENAVEIQRQQQRREEAIVNNHRQFLESIVRQVDKKRTEIAQLVARSKYLNSEMDQTSDTISSHQQSIPRLERGIREDQSEISQGQRELTQAKVDERILISNVASDELKLAEVTRHRNNAQNEMNVRLILYNRYLSDAENLGAGQTGDAITLGKNEGQTLSTLLAKQNGVSVGQELGKVEAKYWGSVRGEIHGYDLGYSEGLASVEDQASARQDANAKAAVDAELFAQINFKPGFFEELVLQEFKKPLFKSFNFKTLIKTSLNSPAFEESMETVTPLSPEEISRSEHLKTPLDIGIMQVAKDVKTIETKARRLSNPEIAFETPTQIPHGSVECTQVYKSLAVFKAACENSYKRNFSQNFVMSAQKSFNELYQPKFTTEFNIANVSHRELSYPQEQADAHKVARAEGARIGKIEIYQTTFGSTYKKSYISELEKARLKAKLDASKELANFLKVKPLLTVASSSLSADHFRGGEIISILGKVKNISPIALKGPVLVRLTEVVNAEKIESEAILNQASGLTLTDLPSLKVKVSSNAKAGEKLIIKGTVDLPGDLYRFSRQEKFELIQALSANPSHDLDLNFNKNPNIKGVFRRNIHFLSVTLTPNVEDLPDGFKIKLTPLSDGNNLMEVKESSIDTGALTFKNAKAVRFSYIFKDGAKDKTISLELTIGYSGKTIKKQVFTLVPR